MLVLSRKKDEAVIVNGTYVIRVIDIRGDKVRLGLQFPTEMSVHREEVELAIQREKEVIDAKQSEAQREKEVIDAKQSKA